MKETQHQASASSEMVASGDGAAAARVSPGQTLGRVSALVGSVRLPLHNEKATQAALAQALEASGTPYRREVALGDGDVLDFIVDGVAIELKLKGSPMAIFRQLQRYAKHEEVTALLLLTARAMHLPALIEGKPAAVASLGKAWL